MSAIAVGIPLLTMTCTTLRELIEPDVHSGKIPHLRIPHDMPSLQTAVDIAPAGGLIVMHEGVFDEQLSISRHVRVRGVGRVQEIVLSRGCEATGMVQVDSQPIRVAQLHESDSLVTGSNDRDHSNS